MCHSDTVHRAAAMFPCGDRPDRFPIRTRFFSDCDIVQVIQLYNYVMDRPATIFRIVFKADPICIFFMLVLLLNLSLAVLYWKKLDKSILVYGKTGQQEILGI